MKYTIPFSKKITLQQERKVLKYYFRDQYNAVKQSILMSLLLYISGIVILLMGSDFSTLLFVSGIFFTFDSYSKNERYNEEKRAYMRQIKSLIKDNKEDKFGIFELREDCLRFSNDLYCSYNYWSEFKNYKIEKSDLILLTKESTLQLYVINKSEVGAEEFDKIIQYVSKKITENKI